MLTTSTEIPNCLEPEGCWCGLLVISEECAWVDHAHHSPLYLVFKKTFPWKPLGNSGFLSTSCPDSLLGTSNKCCTFLHYNPVPVHWFCYGGQAHPSLFVIPPPPQSVSSTRTKLVSFSWGAPILNMVPERWVSKYWVNEWTNTMNGWMNSCSDHLAKSYLIYHF